jgi:hypothetical protein
MVPQGDLMAVVPTAAVKAEPSVLMMKGFIAAVMSCTSGYQCRCPRSPTQPATACDTNANCIQLHMLSAGVAVLTQEYQI